VCQWLATGRWFSPVFHTNKTDRHDITEILLKSGVKHHQTNKNKSSTTQSGHEKVEIEVWVPT
jgi:hypothetical protein